jgi:hypothetical protein
MMLYHHFNVCTFTFHIKFPFKNNTRSMDWDWSKTRFFSFFTFPPSILQKYMVQKKIAKLYI